MGRALVLSCKVGTLDKERQTNVYQSVRKERQKKKETVYPALPASIASHFCIIFSFLWIWLLSGRVGSFSFDMLWGLSTALFVIFWGSDTPLRDYWSKLQISSWCLPHAWKALKSSHYLLALLVCVSVSMPVRVCVLSVCMRACLYACVRVCQWRKMKSEAWTYLDMRLINNSVRWPCNLESIYSTIQAKHCAGRAEGKMQYSKWRSCTRAQCT